MSLIKCSECGADLSDKALACPNCGCPIDVTTSVIKKKKIVNRKKYLLISCIGLGICVTIFFCIHMMGRNCFTSYTKHLGEDENHLSQSVQRENMVDDLWIARQDVDNVLGYKGYFTYFYNATDTEDFTANKINLIGWNAELDDNNLSQKELDAFLSKMEDIYGDDWKRTSYEGDYSGEMTCYLWDNEKGLKVVMKTNEDYSSLSIAWQEV